MVCCWLAVAALWTATRAAAPPRFFPDDPLWHEPDTEDASNVAAGEVSFAYDIVDNLLRNPGDEAEDVRARSINTLDEVPDSSWFTNRIGRRPMAMDEILRASGASGPADGTWTVISAKTDGRTPGFVIADRLGTEWFLKFDPPGYRGMATASEVLVSRFMWALGYHTPEYAIAYLHPDRLALSPTARIEPRGFHERAMKRLDIRKLLRRADREQDGSYRVSASRALPGRQLGPFRFYGTRPDDPNDVIDHEHRRELRALRVFSAWVNHVELRAGNTLDTLVEENGRAVVRHHLLDFGSTLGSAEIKVRPWWEGHDYMYDAGGTWKSAVTLGFWIPHWRQIDVYESRGVGRMPALHEPFDPDAWRPGIPNAAFLRMRADDAFWAAQRVTAFSDEVIRAVVASGRFLDRDDERFIGDSLIARRDAIGRRYLPAVNPIVSPMLDAAGRLTFGNAAEIAGVAPPPEAYVAEWAEFDNATGATRDLGRSEGQRAVDAPAVLPGADGSMVRVAISARSGSHPSWARPVHAYFRRAGGDWTLVGFERLPETR